MALVSQVQAGFSANIVYSFDLKAECLTLYQCMTLALCCSQTVLPIMQVVPCTSVQLLVASPMVEIVLQKQVGPQVLLSYFAAKKATHAAQNVPLHMTQSLLPVDCSANSQCGVNSKKCYGPGGSDTASPSPSSPSSTGGTPASPAASGVITGTQVSKLLLVWQWTPLHLPVISAQVVVQLSSLLLCHHSPWRISWTSSRVTSRLLCCQKQRVPPSVISAAYEMAACYWTLLLPFQSQTIMQTPTLLASRMFWRLMPPLSSLLTPTEMSQLGMSNRQVSSSLLCM